MTDPKLDEARLREVTSRLSEVCAQMDVRIPVAFSVTQQTAHAADLRFMIDALSAERERGDRAVGLLRTMLPEYPRDPINKTSPTFYQCEAVRDFLATQKAEGGLDE